MPPLVRKSFARLSARLQRHFGGDQLIWFPAAAGGSSYTVGIGCRQSEDKGATRNIGGLLTLDVGTITLQAEKADFPFAPREDQIFLLGEANGATPAAAAVKYQITSVSGPEIYSHYTITAVRHG